MRLKTGIITAILTLCFAALAFAQMPKGKWWKLDKIAEAVNLSPEQVKTIEKVFLEHKKHMIDAKATTGKEMVDLEAMFGAEDFDKDAVLKKIEKLVAAKGELQKTKMMFFVEIRSILSKEQFKGLQKKKEELREMRRSKKGRGGDKRGDRKEMMRRNRDRMMDERAPCDDPPCGDGFMGDDY